MSNINVNYARHSKRHPPAFKPGRLASHELTIVFSGSMTYIVDGARCTLSGNDAIFIPEGAQRERMSADCVCDYVSFNFTGRMPTLPTRIENACHGEVMLLLSAIDRIGAKPHLSYNERTAEILEAVISLLEEYDRARRMTPLTHKIISYVHENYRRNIRLRDVADATFFSAVYCENVFSCDMGRSIIDYALELRISEAQRLIIEGAMSLREIAEYVGFSDYNYFSRTFKKRTGFSPTAYRQAVRG